MEYCKIVKDGYVVALGTFLTIGTEITAEEYELIQTILSERPEAPEGYGMHLVDGTYEWELYELPPAPPEEDATDEEIANSIKEIL